jgi:CheY-like chemotaxis protein
MNVVLQRAPVKDMIEECVSMIAPLAKRQDISINIDPTPAVELLVDRTKLKQALINLLSNAVKYNRPAGSVTVSCEMIDDSTLRISISDTGVGIDPGKSEDLFKAFNRLGHENSPTEGTGIGLNFTRAVVNMMGGSIGYRANRTDGTTFYLDFPVAEQWEPRPRRENTRSTDRTNFTAREVASSLSSDQILLVSRSKDTARLLQSALAFTKQMHFRSASPDSDLEKLTRKIKPNIILMDMSEESHGEFNSRLFEQLHTHLYEAHMIALVKPESLLQFSSLLTSHCEYVCLLPIDGSTLYSVIQSLSRHAELRSF